MRKKQPIPFSQKFPNADPSALKLLERLLSFDPKDRLTAEEALADPYFKALSKVEREPSAQQMSKMEFEFKRRRVTKEDVRELIYREILEYHPQMLKELLNGTDRSNFMHPSAVDQFKKQCSHLEEHYGKGVPAVPLERQHASLLRSSVVYTNTMPSMPEKTISGPSRDRTSESRDESSRYVRQTDKQHHVMISGNALKAPLQPPQKILQACVSPTDTNAEETLNTLKYANRARNIQNKAIINRDPAVAEIQRMRNQLEYLQAELLCYRAGGVSSDEVQVLKHKISWLEASNAELRQELRECHESNQLLEECMMDAQE